MYDLCDCGMCVHVGAEKNHHILHPLQTGITPLFLTSYLSLSLSRQGGSKVHFEPHVEEARLSANDEEELQLQPALKMSKEQVHEDEKLR